MLSRYVGRERCLHGLPKQWFTRELFCRRMYLAYVHRLSGPLEHQHHGLEYRARLGRNRPRLARIGQGFLEQLVVERADPRELNPSSRV